MLVQPWNYHDEGVKEHDFAHEWRNGPYSLLLLATQLKKYNHQVLIVDMNRDLVVLKGDIENCFKRFSNTIGQFKPDIIGFGFFSIHYFEVQKAVKIARQICNKIGKMPLFIAGGIHTFVEPKSTFEKLGFDYAFLGEADLGILKLADGQTPESIAGVYGPGTFIKSTGEVVSPLDCLPFPDWSLCDYKLYSYPTFARIKIKCSSSLDMMMGRGCVYRCNFCAYSALSKVRFYSAEYLIEQVEYMNREFGVDGIYFIDSTIGNNKKLIQEFCEMMIHQRISERVAWLANIRSDQVDEKLLKLMWHAGCRYLFYGFESGSQQVLDLMSKRINIEDNYKVAELHNKLRFPYNASMILGYPGEREEDIQHTLNFLRETRPPSIGINWYVPLPGSQDYKKLKAEGIIRTEDPEEWRRIGEVNSCRVYADVAEDRFRELFAKAQKLAYADIPRTVNSAWVTNNSAQISRPVECETLRENGYSC